LLELGLEPNYLTDDVLEHFFAVVDKHKDRINKDSFFKGISWK
jgi:UDP-sulfoquinovose synthase